LPHRLATHRDAKLIELSLARVLPEARHTRRSPDATLPERGIQSVDMNMRIHTQTIFLQLMRSQNYINIKYKVRNIENNHGTSWRYRELSFSERQN
jgi:hypothetical protein